MAKNILIVEVIFNSNPANILGHKRIVEYLNFRHSIFLSVFFLHIYSDSLLLSLNIYIIFNRQSSAN